MKKNLLILFYNHLFDSDFIQLQIDLEKTDILFIQDFSIFKSFNFHKHRIIFYLASQNNLINNFNIKKIRNQTLVILEKQKFEIEIKQYILKLKYEKIIFFEIENIGLENRFINELKTNDIQYEILRSPLFLTSRVQFKEYLRKSKKPFMKTFYELQRKRLKILIDKDEKPIGGSWSYDSENRLPLPKNKMTPDLPRIAMDTQILKIANYVDQEFPNNPGRGENFWLATKRSEALIWLDHFLANSLNDFGPYEDAIPAENDFLFHSVLTPYLNSGLLTPEEVIRRTLKFAKTNSIPIASLEGFIRQIIGWREFVRGIYQNFHDTQWNKNFFNHKKNLTSHWYSASTGIAPLDNTIRKTQKLGYAHHIERLMIVGSLMLLLEVHPHEAYRWFMEMFIDSDEWVMGPNVFGMALFSDGGIFATKPYFCGSNYYRKMGGYKANEPWCSGVDGLYWSFIEKNKDFFKTNHRMSMLVKTVEKMPIEKKHLIYSEADKLRSRLVK